MTSRANIHVTATVLRIDELVISIFRGFDCLQDGLSLALTSAPLFQVLIPLVWEHVIGVEQLFALIPGTMFKRESNGRYTSIIPPEVIRDTMLLRFHMYCSFIKHLDIVSTSSWHIHPPIPVVMSEVVPPGRPLLPNLLSLTFETTHIDATQALWISEILPPCLQTFFIGYDGSFTSSDFGDRDLILHAIAHRCPGLRTLGFLLDTFHTNLSDDLDISYSEWTSCQTYFAAMAFMSDLRIDAALLQGGGLGILGQLPMLESLKLDFSNVGRTPSCIPTHSPPCTFSRLRSLWLHNFPNIEVFSRVWSLSELVNGLSTLRLTFGQNFFEDTLTAREGWENQMESIIARSESRIQHLSICQHDASRVAWFARPNSATFLRFASLMPLVTLQVEALEATGLEISSSFTERHIATFPFLRQLELRNITINFDFMHVLARSMPSLELLQVSTNVTSICEMQTTNIFTEIGSPTFQTLEVDAWDCACNILNTTLFTRQIDAENAMKIAALLAALWPNSQVTLKKADRRWLTTRQEIDLQKTRNVVGLINQQIVLLANRSRELDVLVGELSAEECIITDETWEQCLAVQ